MALKDWLYIVFGWRLKDLEAFRSRNLHLEAEIST